MLTDRYCYGYYNDNSKFASLIKYFTYDKRSELKLFIDTFKKNAFPKVEELSPGACMILQEYGLCQLKLNEDGHFVKFTDECKSLLSSLYNLLKTYDLFIMTDHSGYINERISHDKNYSWSRYKGKDSSIDGHAMLIIGRVRKTNKLHLINKKFEVYLEGDFDDFGIWSSVIHPCYTNFTFAVFARTGEEYQAIYQSEDNHYTCQNIYNFKVPSKEKKKIAIQKMFIDEQSSKGSYLAEGQPRIDGWWGNKITWFTINDEKTKWTYIDPRLRICRSESAPWDYDVYFYRIVPDNERQNCWMRIGFWYTDEYEKYAIENNYPHAYDYERGSLYSKKLKYFLEHKEECYIKFNQKYSV